MELDKSVLRKYDIRGVYPNQINEELAQRLGFAYAKYLHEKNLNFCIVGRDNRFGGDSLAQNLINALTRGGINVIYLDIVTTPMLNFASHKLNFDYGIMITASHNPKNDNGFKLFGKGCLHLDEHELNHVYDLIIKDERELKENIGWIKKLDISDLYLEDLKSYFDFSKKRIKVVIDCGNGTASVIVKKVFDNLNCEPIYICCESDPNFPNHHPDPNVAENLKMLQKKVLEEKADFGVAYDGDADRLGIVDCNGKIIETDKLMAIFSRDILSKNDNKNIIIDVKCSMALEEDIKACGGTPIMVQNGSAFIETFTHNYPALFGGEYSGHIFFNDNHYGYDDGIYGGLRFQQLLVDGTKKSNELTEGLMELFNTPELKVKTDDEKKKEIIEKVKEYCINKNYEFLDIDGVRVKFSDGWALIRQSNTGPNITLRFEAKTRERLAEILKEFTVLIEKIVKK